jgi:HAE1 family hydrophobic/amphiphilic exporter-1
MATGSLDGRTRSAVIHAEGQLNKADDYRSQIISYRDNAPVRFSDVANVIDGVENPRSYGTYQGQPAITVAINRQPGANTIAVVDAIKVALPGLIAQLPPSLKVQTYMDRSNTIRNSVNDVQFTLLIAAGLVIGVIFRLPPHHFGDLHSLDRAAITIIGTFAGMSAMGYSLDNLSLMALTLCVGFVVDDAIVMLENIMRHVEAGEPPLQASLIGSKEVSFTIPSMTIALAAVFIPVIFMGGVVGPLAARVCDTIVIAVLVSGLVSLTLTPMLCSRLLKSAEAEHARRHNLFYRMSENGFAAVQRGYERSLRWSLQHRKIIFGVFILSIIATVQLFRTLPQDFLPTEDTGRINANTEGLNGVSFAEMLRHQEMIRQILVKDPNIQSIGSSVGSGGVRAGLSSGTPQHPAQATRCSQAHHR